MNVNSILEQMMNNSNIARNPIGKNAIEMYKRGDMQGINELARNLCKEKGTSFEEMANKIKSQFNI